MAPDASIEVKRLKVAVARDRFTATIQLSEPADPTEPTEEEVLQALEQGKVALNDEVKKRVAEFVAFCSGSVDNPSLQEPFVVAQGTPAFDGEDEEFIWGESCQQQAELWRGDSAVNYYTFNQIITVEEGGVIGSVKPLVPARNGVDVRGGVIKPRRQPRALELDGTVGHAADDQTKIVAHRSGRVICAGDALRIDEILHVEGNVDFSCGNIDSHTDVNIKGTVQDRFEVKSEKSVIVGGAIEAAEVRAAGDVLVRGGILARQQGKVVAGGEIIAKFANEAELRAGGDIKISKELLNCRTHTEGRVLAERGALIGGYLYAKQGVELAVLGSGANVQTRVAVGIHPQVLQKAERTAEGMKPAREAITRIRESVKPLLDDMRRLTPAQREQATELLFKADKAEMKVQKSEEKRTELLDPSRAQEEPRVTVSKTLYPGTRISIGKRAVLLDKEIKGPFFIEKRKVEDVTELVAVNQFTAVVQVLPSVRLPLEELAEGFEREERRTDQPEDAGTDTSAPDAGESQKSP